MRAAADDNKNFDNTVRLYVYRHFIDRGEPPTTTETAGELDRSNKGVANSYRRLQDARILVLSPNSTDIRMAMPFSGVPTAYRVTVDDRSWWAN